MNRKRIIGATAAAAVTGLVGAPASAAVDQPVRMQAESFAELLQPIPNASEQLRIADVQAERDAPRLTKVQYYYQPQAHHHHHHHSHHDRRWYLRNGYYWYNGGWVLRPRRNHHHHHHHNNYPPRPY